MSYDEFIQHHHAQQGLRLATIAVLNFFHWEPTEMMLGMRTAILCCCLSLVCFLSWHSVGLFAQSVNRTDQTLYVQQATTQMQVTSDAARIAQLEGRMRDDESSNLALRDEVSTQKGVGIGVAAVIGLLQVLQMILQVKSVSGPRRGLDG